MHPQFCALLTLLEPPHWCSHAVSVDPQFCDPALDVHVPTDCCTHDAQAPPPNQPL
jgi:hypothetical protein